MSDNILQYVFTPWGMIIIAIVCSTIGGIVAAVAKNWRKAREAEIEASLKAELIQQGRSAEEIEKGPQGDG
jgi:hypothetical protein